MTISGTLKKETKAGFSSKVPFYAKVKEKYFLNKPGSSKSTLHIVLDLAGSGIEYKTGSCFGIMPENRPELIQEFLEITHSQGDATLSYKKTGEEMSLTEFLTRHANFNSLNSQFLKLVAAHTQNEKEKTKLLKLLAVENKKLLKEFVHQHDPLSFLTQFKEETFPLQELCNCFQTLLPRYYSIASSQWKVGDEVHLMVATFKYEHAGKIKKGVASSYLLEDCTPGETQVPLFLQENPRFTTPENSDTPMIMIGPGTGVAPFIGFLQERIATSAKGGNWLFFGERQKKYDYYYEEFLAACAENGSLKIDTAFSRDQKEKIYVQDRMLAQSEELWKWIDQDQAHIYVCGDAKQMAKDVTTTLLTIVAKEGKLSEKEAEDYLSRLRKEHRLHLDVY